MLLVVLLAGGTVQAAPVSSSSSATYTTISGISSPNAVAATPTSLVALSAASCNEVYTISSQGTPSEFASFGSTVNKCPEQAIAVSPGLGNFPAGEIYVLQGNTVYTISSGGTDGPVITLPSNMTGGYPGLAFDYSGSFGYSLLAVGGKKGAAYAIDASSNVQPIGTFGTGVEGPSVAPMSFGSAGGYLFAAADGQSTVYAMNGAGAVTQATSWKNSEAVSFVPSLACTYAGTGDSYFVADTSNNEVLAFPSAQFSAYQGEGLVLGQYKGVGIGTFADASGAAAQSFASIPGTLEGAAYVACPVGVVKSVSLTNFGAEAASNLNLLGFDPATGELIGSDTTVSPSEIFHFNVVTDEATSVQLSPDSYPSSVTYNPKTNVLFVATTGGGGALTLLNASTYAVLGDVTPPVPDPVSIAYNPSDTKLYVANGDSGTVTVYSLANNQFSQQNQVITLGGTPVALLINPFDNNVYVAGYVTDGASHVPTLWEIQVFQLVGTLQLHLDVGGGVGGITVDPSSGILYVTVPGLDEVVSVLPGTMSVVANIPVGTTPTGIAYDVSEGLVFVANVGSETISLIDGTNVVATFPVGGTPGVLVYDPNDGLVWFAVVLDPGYIKAGGG